jgi:chorismate mutase/prephenate dehydratase
MGDRGSLRGRIDEIDAKILELINERLGLAREIGKLKSKEGGDLVDIQREENVFSALEKANKGPLKKEALRAVFGEIISACRGIQGPVSVAFLGPEGTFSHLAARKKFGSNADLKPLGTIHDVFTEVEKGRYDFGVVPIENSTGGAVNDSLDLLAAAKLRICGEVHLRVSYDLASGTGGGGNIRVIYTHPQAFAQCRRWLAGNFPEAEVVETVSTARAAQKAAAESGAGAIVSSSAAAIYGLTAVERKIEDHAGNVTHFFVVGRQEPGPTGHDATSMLFALEDAPGALYRTLKPLHDAGINMTRIVSIPAGHRGWRYLFFVDLDGHKDDPKIAGALAEIGRMASWFAVLGSYPRGEGPPAAPSTV